MEKLFGTVIHGFNWVFSTGWDIWSGLFCSLPYGDPYIAIVVAMMVFYVAYKTIYPNIQIY